MTDIESYEKQDFAEQYLRHTMEFRSWMDQLTERKAAYQENAVAILSVKKEEPL